MPTTYLHRLIEYDNWANRGLLEFLGTLPPPVLDERAAGVFGSIRETFEHLLSSELSYHRNLSGLPRSTAERPQNPSLDVLQAIAVEAAEKLSSLVTALPAPDARLQLRDGKRAAATILTQLFMHGVEHRAHIGTVLGAAGIQAPELDSWAHGIFANGDDWPEDWGAEPAVRARFPTPDQN